MSKEFIEAKTGSANIEKAARQQRQLSYFTQSDVQPNEYSADYWKNFSLSNIGDNNMLRWVCNIFRQDNFNIFTRYLRYPLASSKIIQKKVQTDLNRVFFSEDSYFRYVINGDEVQTPPELDSEHFNQTLFHKLLFNYNDILVHDLIDVNKATRYFVSIEDVVAIKSNDSVISQIAFCAQWKSEDGEIIDGYLYLDKFEYRFYDREFNMEPVVIPHDLGVTPATYITAKAFRHTDRNEDPVRKSLFSVVRQDLEEYVFLKNLQKMTEPNGSIPIKSYLKIPSSNKKKNADVKSPPGLFDSGNAQALSPVNTTGLTFDENQKDEDHDPIQTGRSIGIPLKLNPDKTIDTDLVQNFLKFFYAPVEAMEYLNNRIKEIEVDIVSTLTGDYFEPNQEAQNEMQVSKGYISKQDRIRDVSKELTRARKISDRMFLALQHGPDNIEVDLSFGSDFFIDSEQDLYNRIKIAPNPIEKKQLLVRLVKNRSRNNQAKQERDMILYHLMPYSDVIDFDKAVARGNVPNDIFELQNRFDYWINMFEAEFGDIVMFWTGLGDMPDSGKIKLINDLIIIIINDNERIQQEENGGAPEDIQGQTGTG